MEFIIAGVGLVLAVWMILGARNRHRSTDHDATKNDARDR